MQELIEIERIYNEFIKEAEEFIKRYKEVIEKDYVSKDKIKAKIEELEKQKENVIEEMDFKAFYRIKDLKNVEIEVVQSLLQKE